MLRNIFMLSKSRIISLLLIFVVVIGGFFVFGSRAKKSVQTARVVRGDIVSEITAPGKITSSSLVTLRFAVAGKVASVKVREGDVVKKGQVIAVLDQEKYEIALREAEWDFQAAKAEFDKLYDTARGRSTETFDERIERTKIDAKHNKAYEELLKARRNLRDTVLTSPIHGTIIKLNVKEGEEIQFSDNIATVADTSSLLFRAEIDETEIAALKEGKKATLILDAFPQERIDSAIKNISLTSVTTSTGSTAYEVDFDLPKRNYYRLGMNGEATIVSNEAKNVLTIPLEAVVDEKSVLVKQDGKFVKREVKLGLLSDTRAEVISGLKEGDEVLTAGFEEIEK
jgi:macrolide-specific efflux system membrane fusion protein